MSFYSTDSRRDESAYASPGPSVPALKIMSQISQPSSGLSESDDEDTLTDVSLATKCVCVCVRVLCVIKLLYKTVFWLHKVSF